MSTKYQHVRRDEKFTSIHPTEQVVMDSTAEWCRPGQMPRWFAISRTHAYELLKDGKIKGVSLRRPGSARGVRLISVESVREFLSSLLAKQEGGVQ